MLPDYFEFCNPPKLLSGQFALENIPSVLTDLRAENPLLLSDSMLEKIGVLRTVSDALLSGGIPPRGCFTEIPPDSSSAVVNRAAALYRSLGCDSLIAVGGGSVLDTAKGVKLLISQGIDDILSAMGCENIDCGARIPFIAVPTTAGTGSEATMVAVILDPEKQIKMEFISSHLLPDAAVLDPRMTLTLPARITASTGMDALCHAVEAYTCLQKNPLSDTFAVSAITLIRDSLSVSVRNGKDQKARYAMANAAFMAGAAFSNSMVGMIHAIGHALGGVCHVPHGEAMTILMPICMEYNFDKIGDLYGELLLPLAGPEAFAGTPQGKRGRETISVIRRMTAEYHDLCGLPMSLRETPAKREDFVSVAKTALNDGAMIVNPKYVGEQEILEILEKAF
ncbi:iron-containing alcohol dehydrogenase [Caproicibacter fermentans]|uniref:Iron-containing alcohol dehydrogenase n=1 Tax=Caproicibacter fermentans TaxID=2576756 RepID=A0A7G8TB20_9FIRM|nr:iron-containing alcohol dehydrogenase [Caproicibacter fermentans]QNK40811.1 iron-containing alcohol dehydrogenase [Caproicibacter fermentans]